VGASRFPRARVLLAVPSSSSEVERRAAEEAVREAGARSVTLVEEPLAAAIGAGLPVHEPIGNLVVDVGGGRSEMAVVSMGGVVTVRSVGLGGFALDAAIAEHVRTTHGVAIGERAAEEVKIVAGSAFPGPPGPSAVVAGRDLSTGDRVDVDLTGDEVRQAITPPVRGIVETARRCLAEAPPELTHDILETGLFLTGGGSLLRGLDMLLARECEVPVRLADRPRETVVVGAGTILEHLDDYRASFQLVRRH
jgi:rod shape-determining protein MreB